MTIALDSSPVGLLIFPKDTDESLECQHWMAAMLQAGHKIVLPEIVLYETRRELLRMNRKKTLDRLEILKGKTVFMPLDSIAMYKAAEFWAESRRRGNATASEKSLDIDVILAAQAWRLSEDDPLTFIATSNRPHLSQFVPAAHWTEIDP